MEHISKTTLTLFVLAFALVATALYFQFESRQLKSRIDQLQNGLELVQSSVEDIEAAEELAAATCDSRFPAGLYRLVTSTNYGPTVVSEYEIFHVSAAIAGWGVNLGTRVNSFGVPTDFYLDYNNDGRIDTALAARFVREIPLAGNTIADRLLADSRVHQSLYTVFSCEWRNAEYTSAEDMNDSVSGSAAMLWNLVEENSENIIEWIGSE